MSDRRRVVVTGMGVVSPLGCNVDTFWERLIAARSGIAPIRRWDASMFDVRFGGECDEFDLEPVIDRRNAKRLDRFAQFAAVAAHQAFAAAGLSVGGLPDPREGLLVPTDDLHRRRAVAPGGA